MKSIITKSAILILFAGIFSSCEKNYVEKKPEIPVPVGPTGPTGSAYMISFSGRIIPMFSGCGCHTASLKPDLTQANAYASLLSFAQTGIPVDTVAHKNDPENNLLYLKVKTGGSMNQYLSNPSDADSMLVWMQQGAKNN